MASMAVKQTVKSGESQKSVNHVEWRVWRAGISEEFSRFCSYTSMASKVVEAFLLDAALRGQW